MQQSNTRQYEYVTDDEDYNDGAVKFNSIWDATKKSEIEYVASDAANHYYDSDPDPDDFPLTLSIFCDGKNVGKFEVCLDFSPNFSSSEI